MAGFGDADVFEVFQRYPAATFRWAEATAAVGFHFIDAAVLLLVKANAVTQTAEGSYLQAPHSLHLAVDVVYHFPWHIYRAAPAGKGKGFSGGFHKQQAITIAVADESEVIKEIVCVHKWRCHISPSGCDYSLRRA